MKSPMPVKPPEMALWPLGIFSARMSAKPAGRKITMDFRRFAEAICLEASGNLKPETGNLKKLLSSVFGRQSSDLRLRWYSIRLRFKRCEMPSLNSHTHTLRNSPYFSSN